MIQRKQTLFILLSVFLSISLLFIKSADVIRDNVSTHVFFVPLINPELNSTLGHYTAIALNFMNLLFAFAVIFLYKKRHTQIRLTYLIIFIWGILGLMLIYCPFVIRDAKFEGMVMNYSLIIVPISAIVSNLLAIRFIKKDIALLKSADRIR